MPKRTYVAALPPRPPGVTALQWRHKAYRHKWRTDPRWRQDRNRKGGRSRQLSGHEWTLS